MGRTQLEGVFPHLQRLDQSYSFVRELSTQHAYIMDDLEMMPWVALAMAMSTLPDDINHQIESKTRSF